MEVLNNESGFNFNLPKGSSSIIKVIGVGGGGNNALKHMYEKGIKGVDFIICNTDSQALDENPVSNKIQLGVKETEGLGAGADPEVGKRAAQESIDEIKAMLGTNTKMVFITAGMGGGTGTGAAPVIAKTAKDMGILTVGIVTVPFSFEGPRRLKQAEEGLEELRQSVDSLIVINNDKLRQQFGNLGFKSGFAKADEILSNAAKGMAEVITGYFIVNIDFRDAKSVLQNSGTALMSEGIASGENKAEEAVRRALDSPLLNDNKITGAKNVLLLIRSGNQEVTMDEIGLINDYIQKEAGNTADIIFGIGVDEALEDDISVLVIATGFAPENQKNNVFQERVSIPLSGKEVFNTPSYSTPVMVQPKQPLQAENVQDKVNVSERKAFTLEDKDDVKPNNIPTNAFTAVSLVETQTMTLEEPQQIEQNIFKEEEQPTAISFDDREEIVEENKSYDLFSYNELEAVSYTFDLDNDKKAYSEGFSQQEEISFKVKNVEEIVEEKVNEIVSYEEELPKIEEKIALQEEPIVETKQELINEEKEIFFEAEQKEEFTIVEKKREDDVKVLERRNKLRDFNSRYHTQEEENVFETIPAFKRRNLNIDLDNASEQRITSFVSEQSGKVQLRENKFLNKDVD